MSKQSCPPPLVSLAGTIKHISPHRLAVGTPTGTFTVLTHGLTLPPLRLDLSISVTGTLRRRQTLRESYYEILASRVRIIEPPHDAPDP